MFKKPPLIMVIDDNNDVRTITELILESSNYRVLTAKNGRDAMNVLSIPNCEKPSAIILDWEMPEMNGKEFLLERMQIDWLSAVPVIVYSGYPLIDQEVANLPINACLSKPIGQSEFLMVVENAIFENHRR